VEASNGEALLGTPLTGKASKSWSSSMGHWLPSTGSGSTVKLLGDGTPDGEYAMMGGDEAGTSLMGGAPAAGSSRKSGSSYLPWKSGKRSDRDADVNESLLERVQVDGDWELIRPSEGRPYWHNSATQVSQWEPPDFLRHGHSP